MKTFKIGSTDIFLDNYEKEGQGKITISDSWRGAYTCFWGSMGGTLEEFICRISSDYFADKLCKNNYVFDAKKSATQIRKFIRRECSYELPWYKYLGLQSELRSLINQLEYCSDDREFVDMCMSIPKRVIGYTSTIQEDNEFSQIITPIFTEEPWHFIATELSSEYKWIKLLHKDIKKLIIKSQHQ